MDEPLIGPVDPDPAVYETGRWRSPRRLARVFSGARRAQGLFDPDRGPCVVPGTVLLAAGVEPAPTALTPLVQHVAPQREQEHDIGLQGPPAPACPGHERVISELRDVVRRLDAENWRLRRAAATAAAAGLPDQHNGNGSTTSGGPTTGRPATQAAGDAAGDALRVGTVDRTPQPPGDADLGEGGGAADGDQRQQERR